MKYLRIVNQGVIEPQALSLLGASTKRNDNTKIGMFGSGNKYALAYFLRNGSMKVFSGKNEISIEVKKETFREQEFNVIYINGDKTSITTDFGIEWKFWQATREIYANALDEGNATISLVDKIKPAENETHFYIQTNETDIKDFVDNFDTYFSEKKRVLWSGQEGSVLEKNGESMCVYRKGIRCFDSMHKSIFDYNIDNIDIGENRMALYSWRVGESIWKLLLGCKDKIMIERLLRNCWDGDYYEGDVDQYTSLTKSISTEFFEVLKSLNIAPRSFASLMSQEELRQYVLLPDRLFNHLQEFIREDAKPKGLQTSREGLLFKEFVPDRLQQLTIDKALNFFKECDFHMNYPIKTAVFEKKKVLAIARLEHHDMVLSDIAIAKGVNEVVNAIIEEYIHLKYDVKDETRAFQDASISEFIDYMKRKNSYVL